MYTTFIPQNMTQTQKLEEYMNMYENHKFFVHEKKESLAEYLRL